MKNIKGRQNEGQCLELNKSSEIHLGLGVGVPHSDGGDGGPGGEDGGAVGEVQCEVVDAGLGN